MSICVVLNSDGTLTSTGQSADQCSGYVLQDAAQHAQFAELSTMFAFPDAGQANEVFAYCFGLVLACNVLGYVTGAVVKMVSTDRA